MNLYTEYEEAVKELDALTAEGFFGENVKQLMLQREHNDAYEHLYNCFLDWAQDDRQYGKENVAQLIYLFLKLYVDSLKCANQETIDIITNLWKGTPEFPTLECISGYTEYLRTHKEFINLISELRVKTNISVSEKKKLGMALINAYAKGIEFISKILTRLLALLQIINNSPYDILKNSEMTLAQKTKSFLELSRGKYDILITKLDRDIRNAEAHLNIYYSTNENVYILQKTVRKGKNPIKRKIPPQMMITEIYPVIGWVSQAFIYSSIILILAHENGELFQASLKKVQEIGHENDSILLQGGDLS